MKKSLLFSAVLAGLMLGSCSSSDDLAGGNNTGFNENGDGFVAVAINLPTRSGVSSRANDVFDDGEANEYEVKNAKLLLFNGADEASATFVQAYPLTSLESGNKGDADKQITTHYEQTVKISSSGLTKNIYALVVLNDNGQNYTVGDKLSKILTVESSTLKNKGFLMTNAPLSTKVGAASFDGAVNTLVPITEDNIQKTPEAAKNKAVEISVERALAKIEMGAGMTAVQSGEFNGPVNEAKGVKDGSKKIYYTVTGWELANTNKKTYFSRSWDNTNTWAGYQAAGSSSYRFIGTNSLNDDTKIPASELYRTYWAIDPNYDAFTSGDLANSKVASVNQDKIKYCLENTFNVAHQKIQSTTCAIVGVQFFTADNDAAPTKYTPMPDFYTVDSDPTVMYDRSTIEKLILGRYVAANSEALAACIDGTVSALDLLKVTETSTDAGVVSYTVTAEESSKWITGKKPTPETLNGWKSGVDVKDLEHVKNGINYYYVPIRHFDEDETPWSADNKTKSYPNEDGKAEQNWLGRYGVLRNNWYLLEISDIAGFGSANVPDLENNTDDDDNLKEYISVKINVLSWAKRTQRAILGQ